MKDYLSAEDVPSTFFSLISQHRSDIVRLAVLARYGGIYMDISTLCLKRFDSFFSNLPNDSFILTKLVKYAGNSYLPNHHALMARTAKNPVANEFLRRMNEYQENPATSNSEMVEHERLRHLKEYYLDSALRIMRTVGSFNANLFILKEMMLYVA